MCFILVFLLLTKNILDSIISSSQIQTCYQSNTNLNCKNLLYINLIIENGQKGATESL